jgi:hypothetical protein
MAKLPNGMNNKIEMITFFILKISFHEISSPEMEQK